MYPIIGLLIFILDIYCIVMILKGGGDAMMKLVWILLVLILPLVGPILYLMLGQSGRTA